MSIDTQAFMTKYNHLTVSQLLVEAAITSHLSAFVMVDIVNFSKLNAEIGYSLCDEILANVSKTLQSLNQSVDDDLVIHYYADKFVLILKNISTNSELLTYTRYIKDYFGRNKICLNSLEVPIDVLVSGCRSVDVTTSGDSILQCLEWAISMQKTGESGPVLATPALAEMHRKSIGRYAIIRDALSNGEIRNYYQPIIDMRSTEVVGVETLVRWINPTVGTMLPNTFLPIIEETRQMKALTMTVLSNILNDFPHEEIRRCKSANPNFYISINVPPSVLVDEDFRDGLLLIVNENPELIDVLSVEITEQTFDAPVSSIIDYCNQLRSHGIKILIDDFGNGYSSLGRIGALPIDAIKIDRMFLLNKEHLEINECVIAFAINLAKTRNIKVIFEGVADRSTSEYIKNLGGIYGQGFFYSKPVPSADLIRQLAPKLTQIE